MLPLNSRARRTAVSLPVNEKRAWLRIHTNHPPRQQGVAPSTGHAKALMAWMCGEPNMRHDAGIYKERGDVTKTEICLFNTAIAQV